ncbi:MAG: NAD(P)-dependent oxidoreductase [Arhodomonas sp.]|nr:NAD(P)-dependent oxidoreductase [Arhodomonas sp.]
MRSSSPRTPRSTAACSRPRRCPSSKIRVAEDATRGRELAPASNIVLGKPALVAEVLDSADALEWVQSTYAGVDALLPKGLRRTTPSTGVKDVFGPLMSEYVFGWLIAIERQFFALRAQQRERRWAERDYRGLAGRTMGIAGLGSIGQHIAATANHFGLEVLGYKRSPGEVAGVKRVSAGDELARLPWRAGLPGTDPAGHRRNPAHARQRRPRPAARPYLGGERGPRPG